MAHVFFVSYARADGEFDEFRVALNEFVAGLTARVAMQVKRPLAEVAFFDSTSIEVGDEWPVEVADSLRTAKVGVALYSPNYFTRPWCGREFQAFLTRRQAGLGPGASGIVPVLLIKGALPPAVSDYQWKDGNFPDEYAQLGMMQLQKVRAVRPFEYEQTMAELTARICAAASGERCLAPAPALDVDALESAWDVAVAADPRSHTEGSVSKTCFVFVSQEGWHWQPYPTQKRSIGALAQRISGDLGLRYEEITCDAQLKTKLDDANRSKVPTVIFGDPGSLTDEAYAGPMRDYDKQYLLNCATLVPWDEASRQIGDNDGRWVHLKTNVCSQKTLQPPPYHEWRSIFSLNDLEVKTRAAIEQVRSGLMKRILSESQRGAIAPLPKAENSQLSEDAATLGIKLLSPAVLEGPTR